MRSRWSSASRRGRTTARQVLGRASATSLIGNIVGAVITRLIGAVLPERNDEWQLQHRYMQVEAMAELVTPAAEPEPARIPPQAAQPVATSKALESTPA